MPRTYAPSIHSYTAMRPSTAKALQSLWDSHPDHPALMLSFCESGEADTIQFVQSGADVVTIDPHSQFHNIHHLEDARNFLDQPVLGNALLEALSDRWITEFIQQFHSDTSVLKPGGDIFQIIIMPNCLLMHHTDPDYLASDMLSMWGDDSGEMWNFAILVAGETRSAHEKMVALSAIEAARPLWSRILRHIQSQTAGQLVLTEPEFHPGKDHYDL